MTRRRTAHARARSRTRSSGASFKMYAVRRREEPPGPTPGIRQEGIYPEVKNVNTLAHTRKLISIIEHDNIPHSLKRQRLHFMYALSYSPSFKAQFKDDIREARDLFFDAYRKYTEQERTI